MNENEVKNKINEDNKNTLIKNLNYDMDTNKLMIHDNENHYYLCDIFGRKNIKFLPNITGFLNRYKQNLLQDKKVSYFKSTNYFSLNNKLTKNSNLSIVRNETNKRHVNYFPTIRKFEGYSKFPRPIGPPLINIPNYRIKEKNKRKIINNLYDYFEEDSAKKDIIRKNENNGVSYLTSDVNDYDLINHDTEQSLKLIKNSLNDFRDQYRLKLNIMHKDPNVRALNQYKKSLLLNKDSRTINGRILDEPPEKIKKNYKIINSIIKRTGFSLDKVNEENRIKNIFNKIKYQRKNKAISKDDNYYNNSNNESIISSHDRLNFLCKSKDFTIGKLIDDKSTINDNRFKQLTEISKTDNLNTQNTEDDKVVGIEDAYKDTEETLNNTSNIKKSENNEKIKNLKEKKNKSELSFISHMTENQKKYEKENNNKIKFFKKINENTEHYNRLLKGYQEIERTPTTIYPKSRILKLKTNGDLFRENIKLLRLTNREAFKIQEKKELYDLKLLEKKLKNSAINANNVMKGKSLKINKDI